MSWGGVLDADTTATLTIDHTDELLAAVDGVRGFVVDHLRGRPSEVDAVLQTVRETVWHAAGRYDPILGCPAAFVFGVTRNIVRREQTRKLPPEDELPEEFELADHANPDPLATLVRHFDRHRWIALVADHIGAEDWEIVLQLALDAADAATLAAEHGVSVRAIRTIRDRVALTTHTVRAALAAADTGLPVTAATLLSCLPDHGGLREVADLMARDQDPEAIADRLGLHPGSARARIATVKKLLALAVDVLDHEHAA